MPTPAQLEITVSRWPLVTLQLSGLLDDASITALFNGFAGVLRRKEPFVVLVDARQLVADNPRGARHRSEIADFIKAHRRTTAQNCKGLAVALSSRPVAMGLNAIFLLAPLPLPMHTAATPQAAAAWLTKQCTAQEMLTPDLAQALETWNP